MIQFLYADEVKTGVFRQLFDPSNVIQGVEDGANSYARGSVSLGKKKLLKALNLIRRLVEKCEELEGFILLHSLGGGTGSGLTSVLLHALMLDYDKAAKCQIPVYPGSRLSTSIVEPYNTTLHLHSTMETTNLAFILDNGSLFKMCKDLLNIYSPFYININRIIAVLLSAVTCSMRFDTAGTTDLTEMQTNLVPYPRVHFPILSHSPIRPASQVQYDTNDIKYLLKELFHKENHTINCGTSSGSYMAIMLSGRGDISCSEMSMTIQNMRKSNPIKFVEWSPNGFKLTMSRQVPMTIPQSEMGSLKSSITMICNHTALKNTWNEIGIKFDSLFKKRAYIHSFIEDGMDESQFVEARLNIAMLWEDYEEISMTSSEIEKELNEKPDKLYRINTAPGAD